MPRWTVRVAPRVVRGQRNGEDTQLGASGLPYQIPSHRLLRHPCKVNAGLPAFGHRLSALPEQRTRSPGYTLHENREMSHGSVCRSTAIGLSWQEGRSRSAPALHWLPGARALGRLCHFPVGQSGVRTPD